MGSDAAVVPYIKFNWSRYVALDQRGGKGGSEEDGGKRELHFDMIWLDLFKQVWRIVGIVKFLRLMLLME